MLESEEQFGMEEHESLVTENAGLSNETMDSQEEESVVYFRQRLAEIEKSVELLVTSILESKCYNKECRMI